MTSLTRSLKKSIPSIFTLLNLLAGCTAALLSFHDIALAALMVLLAGLLDFVDGLAARIFDAYTEFGKELDSLADMVSFGVAPSFILFQIISTALISETPLFSIDAITIAEAIIIASAFFPVIFAAIRLARFNVSAGEKDNFTGLPAPAAGLFIAFIGYVLFTTDSPYIRELLLNSGLLLVMSIVISALMVIPLSMFSIKFRNLRLADNKIRYLFILPSLIIVLFWGLKTIPLIIVYYILLSLILALIPRKGAS